MDDKKKRYGKDKKAAAAAKQKRQAAFTSMCKEYKKANPDSKRCKLTTAQEAELKAMVSKVQGAMNRESDPNYPKTRKADKAIIRAAYNK